MRTAGIWAQRPSSVVPGVDPTSLCQARAARLTRIWWAGHGGSVLLGESSAGTSMWSTQMLLRVRADLCWTAFV